MACSLGIDWALPQPYCEAMFRGDQIGFGVIVSAHSRDDFMANAHAAEIHIAIVAQYIDQDLVASVAKTGFQRLNRHRIGQAAGAGHF